MGVFGDLHKENLIPGKKYRSFRYDPYTKTYEKGWKDKNGVFTPTKKHKWSWHDIPNMVAKLPTDEGYPNLYAPIRAVLKISAQRLFEICPFDYEKQKNDIYNKTILSLVKDDGELQKAWKEMTMALIKAVIALIPFPEEADQLIGAEDAIKDLLIIFADRFYDLLFSIEL